MASIIVLGATGYIGAPYISQLVKQNSDLHVTAFARSTDYDAELEKLGVIVAHGTLDDHELVKRLSSQNDIVVNLGNSFDGKIIQAVIDGLKQRKGTLITVSGVGIFLAGTSGSVLSDPKVWNDANEADIKSITPDMPFAANDSMILDAGAKGDIDAYIVSPAGVHGDTKFSEVKSKNQSLFMKASTGTAMGLGFAPYVGNGTAIWGYTHVDDLVALLLLVTSKALNADHSESTYKRYFGAGGEHVAWKDYAQGLAKALHRLGKIADPTPKPTEADKAGFLGMLMQASLHMKYENAAALGYKPKGPSIFETLENLQL